MRRRVYFNWGVSSFFGWGVYGLNLALHWSMDPDVEPVGAMPFDRANVAVDPLRLRQLEPFFAASAAFQDHLKGFENRPATVGDPVLHYLDHRFRAAPAAHGARLMGRPTIGVTFFETAQLEADAVARAAPLPLVVTGSTWNERVLRSYGLTNVRTVIQGVDPTLFHPGPRLGRLADRFLVFSGGKLERRKGQDLVIAAFRRFAERRPDALLVTAWHSPWSEAARTLDASGLAAPVVFQSSGAVHVPAWAAANGLAPGSFLDLGAIPNAALPTVLREMDVGLFPNRCEGGTNLVAMELMACGAPAILSANTGHLDLIDGDNCYALTRQRPLADGEAGHGDAEGWGESDLDEIVEALERAYADRADARARGLRGAETLSRLTWAKTAAEMKAAVLGVS